MADTPHFTLPFRIDPHTGHPAEVEQDSLDDIAHCVEAVLRTRPGERDENPDFGSPELAFRSVPVHTADIQDAVEQWEPRASILIEEAPTRFGELLERLQITVSEEE
jgi:phage baseplate assembly protein W